MVTLSLDPIASADTYDDPKKFLFNACELVALCWWTFILTDAFNSDEGKRRFDSAVGRRAKHHSCVDKNSKLCDIATGFVSHSAAPLQGDDDRRREQAREASSMVYELKT